jgi:HrpA-like RNA helicase
VHERHLNTDLLLALMRALALQRPDLRVIVMSATINVQAYSAYFGAAPVIMVPALLPSALRACP